MQSHASPNGSVASPGWQPILLPGLPSTGKRGKQPVALESLSVTLRQPAGQAPPLSLHWPVSGAAVSSVGVMSASAPVIGSG